MGCAATKAERCSLTKGDAPVVIWFRHDLRLADNPALHAALLSRARLIPLFIWAPDEEEPWPPGAASRWWLHHSLASLGSALEKLGSRLILRRGPTLAAILEIASETGAKAVFFNRRYEPAVRQRDERVVAALRDRGIQTTSFNSALLHEPWEIQNRSGKPFQVFTAFWRHCLSLEAPERPVPPPKKLPPTPVGAASLRLDELALLPKQSWTDGLQAAWNPGERGAVKQLEKFLVTSFAEYGQRRDRPDLPGTSRLSPHLHFGEISPRQIWHAIQRPERGTSRPTVRRQSSQSFSQSRFVAELGWREFAHHLLHHFPHTDDKPLRPEFGSFRWRTNPAGLRAWERGRTGYPLVDAGMRELWKTGWMHNRVRMVVASFLVKDLLIRWQDGAKWFWDTLVDADLAQNTLGWQWTAGCGADAAPFFRIFNPVMQGEKFDPEGNYVRRWVPELAKLPNRWIHKPHRASPAELARAKIELGRTYPPPIVSHTIAREIALEAYQNMRR